MKNKNKKRIFINYATAGISQMSKSGLRFKKTKDVEVKEQKIKKSQQYMDDQQKSSQEGNKIYDKNKEGRYDITNPKDLIVSEGKFFARVIQKGMPEEDNMSAFEELNYKLNMNSLFFLSQQDDLRGVLYGLNLLDVPTNRDDMQNGDCCYRIEPQVKHVQISLYNFKGYCFRVELLNENWLICGKEQKDINTFRQTLIRQIVTVWWQKNRPGEQAPQLVSDAGCENIDFNWEYSNQINWPCICAKPTSKNQSPVELNTKQVNPILDRFIAFGFEPSYSVRYGVVVQEPEFYGDFGKWTWITPKDNLIYQTTKFTFKIKGGEHPVVDLENEQIIGELQIYGQTNDGKNGVLAILFKEGEENKFMKAMNIKTWNYPYLGEKGLNLDCLEIETTMQKVDLNDFMTGKDTKIATDKSYFKYKGSFTKPPCTENVDWYVLRHPAEISNIQFENLKLFGLNKALINPNNLRTRQPLFDRIVDYYESCYNPPVIKKKSNPPGEYKYIKATQDTTIYSVAENDAPITSVFDSHSDLPNQINIGKNIKLYHLKDSSTGKKASEQVPNDIMQLLIDKYTKNEVGDNTFASQVGASYQ